MPFLHRIAARKSRAQMTVTNLSYCKLPSKTHSGRLPLPPPFPPRGSIALPLAPYASAQLIAVKQRKMSTAPPKPLTTT